MTPGKKTSELWLTILGIIIGPAGLLAFLADRLNPDSLSYAIMTALLAAGAVIWKYIDSRTKVKVSDNEKSKEAQPANG